MTKKIFKPLLLGVLLFGTIATQAQTDNEVQGTGAGAAITTGDYNSIYGDRAGTSLTTGGYNVIMGTDAAKNITNTTHGVYIGFRAGYHESNLGLADNVFIGSGAGFNNKGSGFDNVYVGKQAGYNFVGGDDNTFVGDDAGGGGYGFSELTTATTAPATGSDNTALGSAAGFKLKAGHRNTFVGAQAGFDVVNGYKNTFVGDSTGTDLSNGRLNSFFGQAAGSATEHASYNTFIGASAGGDNNRTNNVNDANRNTYVGVFTGFSNREGEDNVGMGAFANYKAFPMSTITNATGFDAGYTGPSNHSRTTFIGARAVADADDATLVGYGTQVKGQFSTAIGSHSQALANYAMALGSNVIVNQTNTMALGGDQTTNRVSVGIGTVAANQKASLELADSDKGLLLNRLTTAERSTFGTNLTANEAGMLVFDKDTKQFFGWDGAKWVALQNQVAHTSASNIPELLNYQSVIRNAAGDLLANQSVKFKMSIVDNTATTTSYIETHTVTTTAAGIVNLTIGGGTAETGTFGAIDWSHNNSLKVEVDITGGTNYTTMGTTSFVSVPYAIRAKYAENIVSTTAAKSQNQNKKIEALEAEIASLKAMMSQFLNKK